MIVLLLLVCMASDPDQCMQFPAHPPSVVTEKACAAKAKSEFAAGAARSGEDGKNLTLGGYFCGYLVQGEKGRPS